MAVGDCGADDQDGGRGELGVVGQAGNPSQRAQEAPLLQAGASPDDNGGTTLVIEFDGGLPDQACFRIDLASSIPELSGDTDCRLKVLAGDTNGDGNTNLIDMAQTKSKNGSDPMVPGNARFDVNVDGNINLIDMALVKSLNGNSASCP